MCRACIEIHKRDKTPDDIERLDVLTIARLKPIHIVQSSSNVTTVAKSTRRGLNYAFNERQGFIHMSGYGCTSDRNLAWSGTKAQFKKLVLKSAWRRDMIDANEFDLIGTREINLPVKLQNPGE